LQPDGLALGEEADFEALPHVRAGRSATQALKSHPVRFPSPGGAGGRRPAGAFKHSLSRFGGVLRGCSDELKIMQAKKQ